MATRGTWVSLTGVLLVGLTGGDLYSFSFKEKQIKGGVYFLLKDPKPTN